MDRQQMEKVLKQILFTEPEFSNFLKECSQSIQCPFASRVSGSSDEYIRYLETQKTDDMNEVHMKTVRTIQESRDKALLKYLKMCYVDKEPPFCDMEIHVANNVYKVHRLIVAPFIPILMNALSNLPNASQSIVIFKQMKPIVMECFLRYIYTGEMKPLCDNFIDVLEMSIGCEMKSFAEKWIEAFESTKPLKVLQLVFKCRLARKYGWKEYIEHINKVLALQFENLIVTEKFLRLPFTEFSEILQQDEFGTSSEVIIYLSVIKWLNNDWLNRKRFAAHLMREIRFNQMSKEEQLACYSPPVLKEVMEIPEIKAMITDALLSRLDERGNKNRRIYRKVRSPHFRLWLTDNEINDLKIKFNISNIHLDSGDRQAKSFDFKLYDKTQGPTIDSESKPRKMWHYTIDALSTSPSDQTSKDSSPEVMQTDMRAKYNFTLELDNKDIQKEANIPIIEKQIKIPEIPELTEQTSPDTSTLSSYPITPDYLIKDAPQPAIKTTNEPHINGETEMTLLLFGDKYDSIDHQHVFRWDDPNSNSVNWKKENPSLPKNPEIPVDCVISNDSKNIYCIAGIDVSKIENELKFNASTKIFKYDLKSNTLKPFSELKNGRALHSVVILNDLMYIIGGKSNKEEAIDSMDVYSINDGNWIRSIALKRNIFGFACAVIKKRIFIFGGIKLVKQRDTLKFSILSDVIVYNPVTDELSKMKATLPVGIAFASAVVHENKIYVIGGRVKQSKHSQKLQMSNKVYCFDGKTWTVHSNLNQPRCHMYCFIYKSKMFAFGGSVEKERRVDTCEFLDMNLPQSGWKLLKTRLPVKTTGNMITFIPTQLVK